MQKPFTLKSFTLAPLPFLIWAMWPQMTTAAETRSVLMPLEIAPPALVPPHPTRVLPPQEYIALKPPTPLPAAIQPVTAQISIEKHVAPESRPVPQLAVHAAPPAGDDEAGAPAAPYPVSPYMGAPVLPMAAMPNPYAAPMMPRPAMPSYPVQVAPVPQVAPAAPFGFFPAFPQTVFKPVPLPAPMMMPTYPAAPLRQPGLPYNMPNPTPMMMPVQQPGMMRPGMIPQGYAPVMAPRQPVPAWMPMQQPIMPFGLPQSYFPWLNPIRQPVPVAGMQPMPGVPWMPQQPYLHQQAMMPPMTQWPPQQMWAMPQPAFPQMPFPQAAQLPMYPAMARPAMPPALPYAPSYPMGSGMMPNTMPVPMTASAPQMMPMQPMQPMAVPQPFPAFWMMPFAWFNGAMAAMPQAVQMEAAAPALNISPVPVTTAQAENAAQQENTTLPETAPPSASPATLPAPEAAAPVLLPEQTIAAPAITTPDPAPVIAALPAEPQKETVPAPKPAVMPPTAPARAASAQAVIDPCAKGFKKVRSKVKRPKGAIMRTRKPAFDPCK